MWLVGEIDNGGPVAAMLFAGSRSSAADGTVMLAAYMQGSNVLAHELGHAFNLYHTFEGDNNGTQCPPNGACGTDGDQVCDIPPHIRPGSCNPAGTNSCDGGSAQSLHIFNYMNYSSCAVNMFTAGQRTARPTGDDQPARALPAANGNPSGSTERAAAGLPRFRRGVVRHRPNGDDGRPDVPLPAEHLF
ncbi:MAG: hypothetical protein IPP33_02470 [Flavobacteriales bacterium]|nr:hypothetical protein [Flavobacteriales bacterium]